MKKAVLSYIFRNSSAAASRLATKYKAVTAASATTAASKVCKHSRTDNVALKHQVATIKLPSKNPQLQQIENLIEEEVNSILGGPTDTDVDDNGPGVSLENTVDIPGDIGSEKIVSFVRKYVSRNRKDNFFFTASQGDLFDHLVKKAGHKLSSDNVLSIHDRLGQKTGLKEYNSLLALCISEARETDDEDFRLEQHYKAYQLFQSIIEVGFPLLEETYGPFLDYLIDFGLVREFYFYSDIFKHQDTSSLPRLAYYEMRLCIVTQNKDKIQELLNENALNGGDDKFLYQENYLLALCESDHKQEFLRLLETLDITKVSRLTDIFKMLGKHLLESWAKIFMHALKFQDSNEDTESNIVSNVIYNYVISIPNLPVNDVILKFKKFHSDLELALSPEQYAKLIKFSCKRLEVHLALDIADEIFNMGTKLTIVSFQTILFACTKSCDYKLLDRVYSMIHNHGVTVDDETFKGLIKLSKDFAGAFKLLSDMAERNIVPTADVYNTIMIECLREKNIYGAYKVLQQVDDVGVNPNDQTFSYLIANCTSEEEINKLIDEMDRRNIKETKLIVISLINAYVSCGEFEKAKELVLSKKRLKYKNELKSVLVSALSCNGKLSDALTFYEDNIKGVNSKLEPRAVISLIEHIQTKGQLGKLLELLKELDDHHDYWIDGCFRVVKYCVNHDHLRPTIDLLKQVKDKCSSSHELVIASLFDEVYCQFAEREAKSMKFGLGLLKATKKEMNVSPTRKSLDFLLTACINANDLGAANYIWKEYETHDYPYNVLTYLRMYQVFLALGSVKAARNILSKISKDDPHVCAVIKACKHTFLYSKIETPKGTIPKEKNKLKKKKKKKTKKHVEQD